MAQNLEFYLNPLTRPQRLLPQTMTGSSPQTLIEDTQWLRRLCRALVHDVDLADDLYHDTVVAALADPAGTSRPWLARVARNLAVTRLRREMRRREVEGQPMSEPTAATTVDLVAEAELQQVAVAAVTELEEPYRTTLLLRFMRGLSLRDVAREMKVPVETVRTRQRRGLALLREDLEGSRRGRLAMVTLALRPRGWVGLSALVWGAIAMKTKMTVAAVVALCGLWAASGWASEAALPAPLEVPGTGPASVVAAPSTTEQVSETSRQLVTNADPDDVVGTPAGGSLLVRVRREDTGEPVSNVSVQLRHDSFAIPRRLTSGADGTVVFEGLQPGVRDLLIGCDRSSVGQPELPPILAGEQSTFELTIESGWDLRGIVVDPEGRPVAGATVFNVVSGFHPFWVHELVTTDSAGEFSLECLGRFSTVGASFPGLGRSERIVVMTLPREGRVLHEVRIELPGESAGVTGVVTDPAGRVLENAFVRLGAEHFSGGRRGTGDLRNVVLQPTPTLYVTTGSDGRFEAADLAPGAIPLFVYVKGFAPWTGTVDVAPGATQEVNCQLTQGATLSGVVLDAAGLPVADAWIEVPGWIGPPVLSTNSDAEGRFRLHDLAGGDVTFEVSTEEHGERTQTVWVEPGRETACEVTIAAGRTLRGRIVDEQGHGLAGYFVYEVGRQGATARTDEAGRFVLTNCEDRAYSLLVFDQIATVPFIATMTDLQPGDTEHVLRIGPSHRRAGEIRGRAVDPHGEPLAEVRVALMQSPDETILLGPTTGADGLFAVEEYPAGAYRLFFNSPGLELGAEITAQLGVGQHLDLGDVVLQAKKR